LFLFSDKKSHLSLHFGLLCACFVLGGFDQGKKQFPLLGLLQFFSSRLSFFLFYFGDGGFKEAASGWRPSTTFIEAYKHESQREREPRR
jgi:hypothetical protein